MLERYPLQWTIYHIYCLTGRGLSLWRFVHLTRCRPTFLFRCDYQALWQIHGFPFNLVPDHIHFLIIQQNGC